MKSFYFLLIAGVLALTVCLAFTVANNGGRTNIKITETTEFFKLTASYNRGQTKKVEAYFNETLKPIAVFKGADDVDTQVTLGDSSSFYIKAAAGWLLVKVDKSTNSAASLLRLKKLCRELSKTVIKSE